MSLQAEAKAWNKLECLVRFRIPVKVSVIEEAARMAGCEVEWTRVEYKDGTFAVVDLVRSV